MIEYALGKGGGDKHKMAGYMGGGSSKIGGTILGKSGIGNSMLNDIMAFQPDKETMRGYYVL